MALEALKKALNGNLKDNKVFLFGAGTMRWMKKSW